MCVPVYACVCLCTCACVRVCVRVCAFRVRVRVHVRANVCASCVRACVCLCHRHLHFRVFSVLVYGLSWSCGGRCGAHAAQRLIALYVAALTRMMNGPLIPKPET